MRCGQEKETEEGRHQDEEGSRGSGVLFGRSSLGFRRPTTSQGEDFLLVSSFELEAVIVRRKQRDGRESAREIIEAESFDFSALEFKNLPWSADASLHEIKPCCAFLPIFPSIPACSA